MLTFQLHYVMLKNERQLIQQEKKLVSILEEGKITDHDIYCWNEDLQEIALGRYSNHARNSTYE